MNKVFEFAATLSLAVMTLLMFLTVLNRFAMHGMFHGLEEWSRITFVWTIMLIIGCCVEKGNFANIAILRDIMPRAGKGIQYFVIQIMGLMISYVLIRYGIVYSLNTVGQVYGSVEIPAWVMYSSMWVGGIGLALNCFNRLVMSVQYLRGKTGIAELDGEIDLSLDLNYIPDKETEEEVK